jgi:hypothetical protein
MSPPFHFDWTLLGEGVGVSVLSEGDSRYEVEATRSPEASISSNVFPPGPPNFAFGGPPIRLPRFPWSLSEASVLVTLDLYVSIGVLGGSVLAREWPAAEVAAGYAGDPEVCTGIGRSVG